MLCAARHACASVWISASIQVTAWPSSSQRARIARATSRVLPLSEVWARRMCIGNNNDLVALDVSNQSFNRSLIEIS